MSDSNIYWFVLRQGTKHELYVELESLGRNRWNVLLGEDEFTFRTKSKDILTVLSEAIQQHQLRSAQD